MQKKLNCKNEQKEKTNREMLLMLNQFLHNYNFLNFFLQCLSCLVCADLNPIMSVLYHMLSEGGSL